MSKNYIGGINTWSHALGECEIGGIDTGIYPYLTSIHDAFTQSFLAGRNFLCKKLLKNFKFCFENENYTIYLWCSYKKVHLYLV